MKKSAALLLCVALGCSSSKPKVEPVSRFTFSPVQMPKPSGLNGAISAAPPAVPSRLIANVGPRTIGPYFARGAANGSIVAYIGNADTGGRRVVAVPVDDDGSARGDAHAVPNLPSDVVDLVVRSSGDHSGFFAAFSAVVDRGESLGLVAVTPGGVPKGGPLEIARTRDHIRWFEVVPTSRGAVLVWTEETRVGDANMYAISVDPDGRPRAVTTRVARGLVGWQAVPASDGVGLALVTPAASDATHHSRGGAMIFRRLDADAQPTGLISAVADAGVSGDVEIAQAGTGYVFAWTDRSREEATLMLAGLDDGGKVTPPNAATEAIGGSALLALVGGRATPLLAWEDPRFQRRGSKRRVHIARIDTGRMEAVDSATLEVVGDAKPELVADGAGYALLTYAQICATGPDAVDPCPPSAPVAPTFVRLDGQGAPKEIQPFRLGEKKEPAPVAWGLDCAGERCLALSAWNDNPTPVMLVDLSTRASPFRITAAPAVPSGAPRVSSLRTLARGEPFAGVAAARVGDTTVVASVAAAGEDGGDVRGEMGEVAVRVLDANGDAHAPALSLSKRALATGGVAVAPGGRPDDGAAVAWVARDGARAQVHVARVNKAGQKTNTIQLTGSKGDTSDVAIVWASGGWVVAWVDTRDGNGEVYAAKLNLDLNRTSHEERLTNAPGDASDVTLLAQGDRVWVAWSDPRESSKDGFADIYVMPVQAKNAKSAGEEVRVMASAPHSRSPSLAAGPDGVYLAWIEEVQSGLESPGVASYGAMIARLDDRGHPVKEPARAPIAGEGRVSSVVLDGFSSGVHAYATRVTRDQVYVDAFDATKDTSAYPVLALDGAFEASIAALGDELYFDDQLRVGERRLRRATLRFRR